MTKDTVVLDPSIVGSGVLAGFTASGEPLVDVPGDPPLTELLARSCVALHVDDIGRDVVVLFEGGDQQRPIVIGVVQPPLLSDGPEMIGDGKHLVVSADESITLRCGEASITLSRTGKIIIRGQHLVSDAAGVNRIRGGSVQLN